MMRSAKAAFLILGLGLFIHSAQANPSDANNDANKPQCKGTEKQLVKKFIWAAKNGKNNVVSHMLKCDFDINTQEQNSLRSALHWATYNGHVDVVSTLLNDSRINTTTVDADELPPLGIAIYIQDDIELAKLIYHSSSIIIKSKYWSLLFEKALRKSDTLFGEELIQSLHPEKIADILSVGHGKSLVHLAIRFQDEGFVTLITSIPNFRINSRERATGQTPLLIAAEIGHLKIFKMIFNYVKNSGSDIKKYPFAEVNLKLRDNKKNTLLMQITGGRSTNLDMLTYVATNVEPHLLLINEQNDFGDTALIKALDSQETVNFLINHESMEGRVDPQIADSTGKTPVIHAVMNGRYGVLRLLLLMGPHKHDLCHKDNKQNRTALEWALEKNDFPEIIKMLQNYYRRYAISC